MNFSTYSEILTSNVFSKALKHIVQYIQAYIYHNLPNKYFVANYISKYLDTNMVCLDA